MWTSRRRILFFALAAFLLCAGVPLTGSTPRKKESADDKPKDDNKPLTAAVKKRIGLGYVQQVRLAQSHEQVQAILEKTKAPKRRAILARLLQLADNDAIDIVRLAGESPRADR